MKPTPRARAARRVAAVTVVAAGLAAVTAAANYDGRPAATTAPVVHGADTAAAPTPVAEGAHHYPRPAAGPLPARGTPVARPTGQPDFTFLSAPDFMNSDIADVRSLPTWRPGLPNSWNSSYAATLDTIMGTFRSEHPDDVFVAGDLVEGHWGEDPDGTGLFGPSSTNAQKKAALTRAADFYFSRWRRNFDERGLPVYAALGDHDIGDNPWAGGSDPRATDFKRNNVDTFKDAFYRNVMAEAGLTNRPDGPAHGTAYATYLTPEVLLVTVDVFEKTDTDVITRLDPQQMTWLRHVLARANRRGTDWIMVQGHVPVITPVRHYGSSAMSYTGGTRSAFWKTLAANKVDVYLNGEVHDVSVERADGITQISHGGTIQMARPDGVGSTNYALGQIYGDTMFVRDNRFVPRAVDGSAELWQVGRTHRPVVRKEVWDEPLAIGHLVLTSDNRLVYSDGAFVPYRG